MKRKVLVLGGGYAGLLACNRLAKLDKNIEIILVNDGSLFVERIRNHEMATGKKRREFLIPDLLHKRVQFMESRVIKIDPNRSEVEIENTEQKLKYDVLIYALGSTLPPLSSKLPNVITKESSESLLQVPKIKEVGSVWVMGGGLTGIELVAEWKESFPKWKVGIVSRGRFASSFSLKGQDYLRKIFKQMQIEIQEETEVSSSSHEKIHFKNGSYSDCQLLIDATGFFSSKVATLSGFRTNEKNQIFVNKFLQVPDFPNVFVAGDACYMENTFLRMGCVTALPLGIHAAENVYKYLKNQDLDAFRFSFMGRNVSLGRKNGLIQLTNVKDDPREKILTGRVGAIFKELICRYTLLSIRLEKWLPFRTYMWPKSKIELKTHLLHKSYE
jgi:NADH dehydrogenase